MKKIMSIEMLCVIIVLILFIITSVPRKIQYEKTFETVICTLDKDDKEYTYTNTLLKGTYYKYFWGTDIFKGTICVEGHPYLNKENFFIIKFDNNMGELYTPNSSITFGFIKIDKNIDSFVICVYEKSNNNSYSWNELNGSIIAAPAKTKQEAIRVTNRVYLEY